VVHPATNLQSKVFTHRSLFSLLLFLVGFERNHLQGPMVTLPTRIVTLFLVSYATFVPDLQGVIMTDGAMVIV